MSSHYISIEFPPIDLSVEDVWPDGDAPDNPTADDVLAVMQRQGSMRSVTSDWNLLDTIEVRVSEYTESGWHVNTTTAVWS